MPARAVLARDLCMAALQMRTVQPGQLLKLPPVCPAVAARIFYACTQLSPEHRPTALDVVHWLREDVSG